MEALKNLSRKFFGFNSDQKSEVVKEEVGNRKRQLEEEVVSKNSLNHSAKRARMEIIPDDVEPSTSTQPVVQQPSPVQTFFSSLQSWFKVKTSPDLVECSQVAPTPPVTIQATPPILYSTTKIDTDEVELLKMVNPKGEVSSQPISDKLATFSGFFPSSQEALPHTPTPRHGHIIKTAHEKARKAELLSPPNVKKQMRSGLRSTFDKFFHERDIAKRVWPGGIVKQKKGKQQNAFQYSAQLADRDVYKRLLERHTGTVVKYSALTNRTSILYPRPSPGKSGPLLGTLDVTTGVDGVEAAKIVTSTAVKPWITSTAIKHPQGSHLLKDAVEASPVLARDKKEVVTEKASELGSKSTPCKMENSKSCINSPRTPRVNSFEQKLSCEEVYSPKYLAKLMDKYGVLAREREKQIQRQEKNLLKCEKDTDEIFDGIDQRLSRHLKITQVAIPETDTDEEGEDTDQPTDLPEMTDEMLAVIGRAERSRGEVLVDAHKIQITVKDIGTLRGLNWLNDEIINFYLQMIVSRSVANPSKFQPIYACTTFFYPKLKDGGHASVKRWTKKVDIFSHSLILVPVHLGMHWCLATIDIKKKAITYYDSMGGNNTACLRSLAEYVKNEHLAKKGKALDMSSWVQVVAKQIPQQMNGSDCGMFTCKFAEYLSRRARITFSQQDMPYFRRRMVYEIVENTLLHP